MKRIFWMAFCVLFLLAACQGSGSGTGDFTVTVHVDGRSQVYRYDKMISVGQFLSEIGVTLNELDEVNPSLYTQLRDGMRITIARVVERTDCSEVIDLPYETERRFNQALPPGEERVTQTGINGKQQVCYRITEKDGVEVNRSENNRITIQDPRNEIIWVGSAPPDTLIPIDGTLAYISNGQAWIIEGNTAQLRPLTIEGNLDGRVFDLSDNGRQLVYTRSTLDENDPDFSNELWVIMDTSLPTPDPVQLAPTDVLYAEWVAGQQTPTVSYSTAVPTDGIPNWQAYNDLWLIQLDPETGETLDLEEVVPSNALGIYSYWGRHYAWSPDGSKIAWALADSVGLVDVETGDYNTLLNFREYGTALANFWVWVPVLSWSDDGRLITTVHGPSYGAEAPEDSIVFDVAVLDSGSAFQINPFFSRSGIWSTPTYSPMIEGPDGNSTYLIAYFRAREPLNSLGSDYELVVADSDGSNARVLFPTDPGKPGLRPDPEDGIAWSPMGRQIALIYQENLWIVDVKTGQANQITNDNQASRPRWSRR